MALYLLILISTCLIGVILFKPYWLENKRRKIASQVFPKEWRKILKANVPLFYLMPADLQLQLKKHILVFLSEKKFYGFEGIKINDEIKVTIAAQACLLLLNRKTNYYPKLQSIYVYPAAFITKHSNHDTAGVFQNNQRILSGESWENGRVVLSWEDAQKGAQLHNDGHNVVIHEFAHQLDQETGSANGAPFLPNRNNRCWSYVLEKEFQILRKKAASGELSLLNHYGATNPAEFFAVASEVFFEKPKALLSLHPALYQQLKSFYNIHPEQW